MFFWIGIVVVLLVFVAALTWGLRGIADRGHEPGTQYMDRPTHPFGVRRGRRSPR